MILRGEDRGKARGGCEPRGFTVPLGLILRGGEALGKARGGCKPRGLAAPLGTGSGGRGGSGALGCSVLIDAEGFARDGGEGASGGGGGPGGPGGGGIDSTVDDANGSDLF